MFISHPCLLCLPASWSPAAPSTPVVFNWRIDSAVRKPGHLQKTPDWLVVKCHRVTKHQADHNVALWPDVRSRAWTRWQTIQYVCLSSINFEWWRRWKPLPHCVEKAVSHRAFPWAMLLVQSWEVSAFPLFGCQSLTVSSLVFTQDRKNNSGSVSCVYSGRAVSGHHAYSSTQLKYSEIVLCSHSTAIIW